MADSGFQLSRELEERFMFREMVESIQSDTGVDLFAQMVDSIREAVASVLQTGKKAQVALVVDVGAVHFKAKNDWASGEVDASVRVVLKKAKAPDPRGYYKRFFVLEDGTLSVQDPQAKLPGLS